LFEKYNWPGNVRQLRKEVERLVALTNDGELMYPDKCSRELVSFYNSGFTANESVVPDFDIPAQVRKRQGLPGF